MSLLRKGKIKVIDGRFVCVYQNIQIDVEESVKEMISKVVATNLRKLDEIVKSDNERLKRYQQICDIVSHDCMPEA